jgi:gas vesicle protein
MLKLKYPAFLRSIRLKKIFTSALFFLWSTTSFLAQYTEIVNSNQPGFSESPYSVGSGVYQLENNFFLRSIRLAPNFSRKLYGGVDLGFRTSFFSEKLEFNAQLNYQQDQVAFENIYNNGFGRLTVGSKYLIYQQEFKDKTKEIRSWRKRGAFDKKRLIPSVGVSFGINADFLNEIYGSGNISSKIGILLQHNLTRNFNIINNFYYNNVGTDFPEFSHIITATQSLQNNYSIFFENQTVFQKNQNNTNLGLGLAYLYSKDLQINTAGRFLFEGKAKGFYGSLGFSYRIDNHQDSYKEIGADGEKIKKSTFYSNKTSRFLKTIFGIFKKKNKGSKTKTKKKIPKKKLESEIEKLEREIKELDKEMKKEEKKRNN